MHEILRLRVKFSKSQCCTEQQRVSIALFKSSTFFILFFSYLKLFCIWTNQTDNYSISIFIEEGFLANEKFLWVGVLFFDTQHLCVCLYVCVCVFVCVVFFLLSFCPLGTNRLTFILNAHSCTAAAYCNVWQMCSSM